MSVAIWDSSAFGKWLSSSGWKLNDDKQYLTLSVDPTAGAGISAPAGSVGVRQNGAAGELWLKTGAADTAWNQVTLSSGAFTAGSVLFASSTGTITQDNSNLFFDDANNGLRITTTEAISAVRKLNVGANADNEARIGPALIGFGSFAGFGIASFSHYLNDSLFNFGLAQLSDGTVFVNSAPGTALNLSAGGVFSPVIVMTTGAFSMQAGNIFRFNGVTSGTLDLTVPLVVTPYTLTFPSAASAANDVMLSTAGSGALDFGKVANANIASGAAIAVNKLAALTAFRTVQTDTSGFLTVAGSFATGLVPYGTANGDLTASAANLSYDTTSRGMRINKSAVPDATLDVNGVTNSLNTLRVDAASGQSVDIVRVDTFGGTEVWGLTSIGLMKVKSGSAGNGTGSIYNISDPRTGIAFSASNTIDLFTNGANNIRLLTTGTTIVAGALDIPKGSVGTPSLTITSQSTDGLYSPSVNQIATTTNGVQRINVTTLGLTLASGVIDLTAGSVTAPCITRTGDLNNGIYFPTTDQTAITTNGVQRINVTNNGLTLASGVLDVPATTSTTVPIYTYTGDLDTGQGVAAANDQVLICGGATTLRTNATGTMIGASTAPVGTFNIFQNGVEAFWLTGTVNTTDATQTTLITFTTASDISYHLEADVVARRTGGTLGTAGDTAAYKVMGFAKNVAGTVTLSTLTVSLAAEDQVLMDATFTVSGTAVRVSVTGTVSNNFTWDGLWKIIRV